MEPITIGILGLVAVAIMAMLVGIWVIRAWIRTLKMMVKLAFYAFVTLALVGAVGCAVAWVLYGEQIQAFLAG